MTAAMAVFGFGVLNFLSGWRAGVLLLAGALVSATGLYEWQQLIELMNAKLDNQKTPQSTGWVLTMFFLRLGFAAVVIYVSLKCFRGPYYALVAGLGLASRGPAGRSRASVALLRSKSTNRRNHARATRFADATAEPHLCRAAHGAAHDAGHSRRASHRAN